ncbi:MAG: hypothetical protein WBA99_06085 [Nodosilinea sp.]
MRLSPLPPPWDMAGLDGLVAARSLFGEAVDYLAPYQSMETTLEGVLCAVLRLGDRNFRVTYPGPFNQLVADLQLQLWVKQLAWMSALALLNPSSTASLPAPLAQATVRAPHRLQGLPLHCAVPAQVVPLPVLIWHHPIAGQPALELHVAQAQTEKLTSLIQSSNAN